MASKENQKALNNLVYFADPFDRDEFNRVERWKNTLQKAIEDLELYKKAFEIATDDVKFFHNEKIRKIYLEQARKELEDER